MKVLIGTPCLLNGGTEVQTLSLVQALVKAGYYPIVSCYFEWDPIMVERFKQAGAKVFLFSKDGKRPIGILNTIKFLKKNFKKIIKDEKPDVAHVQYMAPGALPILVLKSLGIKKILATTHTDANIYGNSGLRFIRFLTNHILSGFQTITLKAEEGYFGSSSLFNGKIGKHFTIYNSLPSHISIRQTPKSFSDKITIGVVSRLERIKGMDLIVLAFAKVLEKLHHPSPSPIQPYCNPSILPYSTPNTSILQPCTPPNGGSEALTLNLLVIGDGSLLPEMKRQAEELGIKDFVTFAGRKTQDELQDYYDSVDILLMPSRSEGFGLTAIEGMARGCVPIVANTGGLPEVVTPGSGLLHNPEDIDDLADKILEVIQNPKKLKELSQGAIERAKLFSFENYKSNIASLYSLLTK